MSTIFILIYPFIMLTHLPLAPRPGKDLFFIPILHFFKVCIDSSRGFCLQACIYHALIISTPHYLLILYHHAPLIFNNLLYSALYYIHI
jgi:hypothetical protein